MFYRFPNVTYHTTVKHATTVYTTINVINSDYRIKILVSYH